MSQLNQFFDKSIYLSLVCISIAVMAPMTDAHALFFNKKKTTEEKKIEPLTLNIKVEGVDDKIKTHITDYLNANKPSSEIKSTAAIQAHFLDLKPGLTNIVKAYGYFHALVTMQVNPGQKHAWQINIVVDLEKPVIIEKVTFAVRGPGANDPKIAAYFAKPPIAVGQNADSIVYENTKQEVFNLAYNRGYLDMELVENEIRVDLDKNTAIVTLVYDTNARYYFGEVSFEQDAYDDKFLQRFVRFRQGDPYSPNDLIKLQEDFRDFGQFTTIDVVSDRENASNYQVPIIVKLDARKKNTYSLGVGWGTDTQFRTSALWQRRRITRTGHYAQTQFYLSELEQSGNVSYYIPGKNPATDLWTLYTGYRSSDVSTGDREVAEVGIRYSTIIKTWKAALGITYHHEVFEEKTRDDVTLPRETSDLLMPNFTLSKTMRDDPLRPSQGYYFSFDVRGASEEVLSTDSFVRFLLQAKYLTQPIKRIRWIFRGELGYIEVDDPENLSLSLRFSTGGVASVRGYAFEEIGPGTNLAVVSFENQFNVVGNWYLTTFVDAGNAENDFPDVLKTGVGGGLVWLSPVGSVSLTVAQPLNKVDHNDEQKPEIQFQIGSEL